jgi:hypothetical protein
VTDIRKAFVTGVGILAIAGMLIEPIPATAACTGQFALCPPAPRGCVLVAVDNAGKACRLRYTRKEFVPALHRTIDVHACYPAAQCRYTTPLGAERRCGTTLLYAACTETWP